MATRLRPALWLLLSGLLAAAGWAQGMTPVPGAPQSVTPAGSGGLAGDLAPVGSAMTAASQMDPLGTGTRLKDIARVTSVRGNQLFGYGLVVGLNGTGDGQQTGFTTQTLINALRTMGINPDATNIRVQNIAAVMVTADLPAFARPGDKIDVLVSSVGDAKTLQGGLLMQTALQGADGEIYAVAQGALSIGGYNAEGGGGGSSQTKNHPTTGMIPNGAYVEREVPTVLAEGNSLLVTLYQADFTTASRVAHAIGQEVPDARAAAIDASTIKISAADLSAFNVVDLIAQLENVRVTPDNRARIIINERTGTVVLGGDVRVLPGAVAHGSLQVEVKRAATVVQPPPLSNGQTVVLPTESVRVEETGGPLQGVGGGATIQDVIASLNALGAKPRDLVAILQAMQAAGLILADVEIQ